MHEYDTTLKSVLTRAAGSALANLTGFSVERVAQRRTSRRSPPPRRFARRNIRQQTCSCRTSEHKSVPHGAADAGVRARDPPEISSAPGANCALCGQSSASNEGRLSGPKLAYECRIVDIRDMDGDTLIASDSLADNVIAILASSGTEREAVRRILSRIAVSKEDERGMLWPT